MQEATMTAAHRPAPNSGIGITCHAGSRGAPPPLHTCFEEEGYGEE